MTAQPPFDETAERTATAPPPDAVAVFGEQLELAQRYAALLAGDGIRHGLIGPREVPRLWERHLVNCAGIRTLLPQGARVVDVGSGAGLPGLVLAIVRPDLRVDLVDSLARRTRFLDTAVVVLGLASRVRVVTGRVESAQVRSAVGSTSWVTARAVAPLDRLAGWCSGLLAPGGTLLAVKGSSANVEVAEHRAQLTRRGWADVTSMQVGAPPAAEPTTVVVASRMRPGSSERTPAGQGRSATRQEGNGS